MAKLAALITAAMAVESLKGLASTVQTELGEHAELDAKDIGARIKSGEESATQLKALGGEVAKLKDSSKETEALKETNTRITESLRKNVIRTWFDKKAQEYGVKPTALETAKGVADFSKISVDVDKQEASGFNQEFFDGLKSKHSILFMTEAEKKSSAAAAVSVISPLSPAGSGAAAQQGQLPTLPGAAGGFMKAFGM